MKTKLTLIKGAALLVLLSTLNPQLATVRAAPGDLDATFGGTGKVRTGFGGGYAIAHAAAVQNDGKLILAGYGNGRYSDPYNYASGGDFLIARFGTNNVLDVSFGDGGRVVTQVSRNYPRSDSSAIKAVRVQADDKIVATGYSFQKTNYTDFTLVRYNPDGTLDTTFGTNGTGIVHTDFGEYSQINTMAIQPDGKIVVAGFVSISGNSPSGLALARYGTNGVLDASFGSGGTTVTSGNGYANAIMIQSEGTIVAVGGDTVFRYSTNGVLDTTFGGTGKVSTPISPNAVSLQFGNFTFQNPDKIVVAGTYNRLFAVTRYDLDGSLDTSFGNNGIVTNAIIPPSPYDQHCTTLIVQGQLNQPRKITVGGWGTDATNYYFALARYTASGALDTTFGTNSSGKITLSLGRNVDYVEAVAYAMALQSGGFVLAGYRGLSFGESDFAAARFTSTGLIDAAFGSNGLVLANISDAPGARAHALAIQPDGKLVVAGYAEYYLPVQRLDEGRFALARFNSDGSLDTSFGLNGKLTTMIGSNDQAYAVAIQPDGKIVAAGKSYYSGNDQFALARYNPDGSADISFGNNGTTTTLLGTGENQINAVRIQSDGKIVAAGSAEDANTYRHFALARFNTNGALDTTFGSGGKVITSFSAPPSADLAYAAGIQSDGKIALAGLTVYMVGGTLAADLAAARYNTNGALDFSFGSLGRTTTNVGGGTLDVAYAMAIQPDKKIVVAGGAGLGNLPGPVNDNTAVNSFVALARFNTNGTLDTSFGNNGTVITQVGPYSDFATSLAFQPDGKIIVAGASQNGFYQFFAQRYNPDGSVDGAYGNGGAALVDFGTGTNEYAYAVALDSSGRAVITGDAGGFFGVTRLIADVLPGIPLRISLTTTNTAVVSWPSASAGWSLQQNTNLAGTNWVASAESVTDNGTNKFITVNPPTANRFYRLFKP